MVGGPDPDPTKKATISVDDSIPSPHGEEHSPRFAELLASDQELQRLVAGEWIRYRASPALQELTAAAHAACARIGALYHQDPQQARRLFHDLVPGAAPGTDFRPPITLDYGDRVVIGERTFINADLLIIGGGLVTIGADCLIGPRCSIYVVNHAKDLERRVAGWERPEPVTIGDAVWLGGSVTITPGTAIGSGSIIGAGSVVTTDIPAGVIAAGNPASVRGPIPAE